MKMAALLVISIIMISFKELDGALNLLLLPPAGEGRGEVREISCVERPTIPLRALHPAGEKQLFFATGRLTAILR